MNDNIGVTVLCNEAILDIHTEWSNLGFTMLEMHAKTKDAADRNIGASNFFLKPVTRSVRLYPYTKSSMEAEDGSICGK